MSSMNHPSQLPVDQLLESCEIKRTRGSGPGGQHRNKVETAIVIRHLPSGLEGQASERRSQNANREVAIFRLRVCLAVHFRRDWFTEMPVSELWLGRTSNRRRPGSSRLESGNSQGKISISPAHDDFPALLAEAMDVIWGEDLDMTNSARRLEVSKSQLLKLLKLEVSAWTKLNSERQSRGLHRLK